MIEQERQQVENFLRKSLQREVDRRILTDIAIANDIDVKTVLREYNQECEKRDREH